MARGDHPYVSRGRRYTHHGIDCGDGTVIHFRGGGRLLRGVERTTLADFAAGGRVGIRRHPAQLDAEETVRRAESRLGTRDYHLVRNNCEHLATWCCTGRAASKQVRRWSVAVQGAFVSVVAGQSLGTELALFGTLGAGAYALAGPLRRR